MLRGTGWLVGALAAALWTSPGAAQTGSSAQQGAATNQPPTGPQEEPGRGGNQPEAAGAQSQAGKTGEESKVQRPESAKGMGSMTPEQQADAARTLAKLHAGNRAEIQMGAWMKDHASNDKVRDFASKMVDDHRKMDQDLRSFAQGRGIELASAEHSSAGRDLGAIKKTQGAQADRAYMKMMVRDHTKDVQETRAAAQRAERDGDKDLASLADESANKMEDHLKEAQKVDRELTMRQARTPTGG